MGYPMWIEMWHVFMSLKLDGFEEEKFRYVLFGLLSFNFFKTPWPSKIRLIFLIKIHAFQWGVLLYKRHVCVYKETSTSEK